MMHFLLLLTLAGNSPQAIAGPFETREMCETHKIHYLLTIDMKTYARYMRDNALSCEASLVVEQKPCITPPEWQCVGPMDTRAPNCTCLYRK